MRHSSKDNACRRVRLAESEVGAVDACECGVQILHIGALTLRLTPEAFRELAALVDEGVRRFEQHDFGALVSLGSESSFDRTTH